LSVPDIQAELIERGMVAKISAATIWRWLEEDALKPWRHRMWIYPRDPQFGARASPALDLYERKFAGCPLEADEFVLSSDEKTSIQARIRCHPTVPGNGRHLRLVEHEYKRDGAFAYLAAWDVHRAKLFGRLEATTGIEPFGRLVEQVMTQEPYRSARRVFWIVDNGSSHRGNASVTRLETAHHNLKLIHLPIHASWLNQIEIYFSVLQRKVLTPADCESLTQLQGLILRFQERYQETARPFKWKFTTADLADLLQRLAACDYCPPTQIAA
jgi:transposase